MSTEGVGTEGAFGTSLAGRHLYLCTPDRPDLESFVEACIQGGVDIVQLRDKELMARDLVQRARRVSKVCAFHSVPFIVNDRPDIAMEAGADGVHIGQDDVSAQTARAILGPGAIVGLSTHDEQELSQSAAKPVDYISAGPVVPTPTKPRRPGTGVGYAATATLESQRPVFVTGDVTPARVEELAAAGVTRFVVVRFLVRSADPKGDAKALRDAIIRCVSGGSGVRAIR